MTSRSDAMADWALPPDTHLVIDDEIMGPFDAPAIRALIAEGRVTAGTFAWHPALDGWAALENLPELSWLLSLPARSEEAPQSAVVPGAPAVEPARLGPRLAAGAVDFAVWLVLAVAIGAPLSAGINWIEGADRSIFNPRFDLLAQMIAALYFMVPMSRLGGGRTPGYRLLGLRLVAHRDLQPPSLVRAFIWYLVSFARLIGWLTYFVDPQHRMLHDFASGTLVIVDRGRRA